MKRRIEKRFGLEIILDNENESTNWHKRQRIGLREGEVKDATKQFSRYDASSRDS